VEACYEGLLFVAESIISVTGLWKDAEGI